MPTNPAPLVTIQDLLDDIQEAVARQDQDRIAYLQGELARKYDQLAAAQSLERNGMSRYTRTLIRRLGYAVTAL